MATLQNIPADELLSVSRPKILGNFSALNQELAGVAEALAALEALVSYGDIHVHDNSTAQSIANGGYVKSTCFADDGVSHGSVTPDAANDQIVISAPGVYEISGTFSFRSGTANITFYCAAFIDGVEKDWIHFVRKVTNAGDVGAAGIQGLVEVTSAPVAVDVRFRHSAAGPVNLTVEYANLTVKRIH